MPAKTIAAWRPGFMGPFVSQVAVLSAFCFVPEIQTLFRDRARDLLAQGIAAVHTPRCLGISGCRGGLVGNAPMSGEISARLIEPGENIGPGTPLFTIVDLDSAWFTFNLREDLLAGLIVGDSLRVRVPILCDLLMMRRTLA